MCDDSCPRVGARRCYRHRSNNGSGLRLESRGRRIRPGSRARGRSGVASREGEEDRSVHQALCGGIVAGVMFGGVLGGVIAGAAAVSAASIVAKRSRERDSASPQSPSSVAANGPAAAASAAAAAAASIATIRCSSSSPSSPSSPGSAMSREQAMFATGRAMAHGEFVLGTTTTTTTTMITTTTTATCLSLGGGGMWGHGVHGMRMRMTMPGDGDVCGMNEGDRGERPPPAPDLVAQPVPNIVAIPCTSRSMRTARALTAVTATPANDLMAGVPVSGGVHHDNTNTCNANGDNAHGGAVTGDADPGVNAIVAPSNCTGTASAIGSRAIAVASARTMMTRTSAAAGGGNRENRPETDTARRWWQGSVGGSEGGAGESGDSSDLDIVDTARRWWRGGFVMNTGQGVGGDGENGDAGVVSYGYGDMDESEDEGAEEEGTDDWWAGEEFEEEWASIFQAFCPEGEGGRLPCLAAREPLQGAGVTGRVARGVIRIADWGEQGSLGADEFAFAMYLCRRYRIGEGIPSMLEAWMIPPALRETRGSGGNVPSPAYPSRS